MLVLVDYCSPMTSVYAVKDKDDLLRLIKEEFGEENLNGYTAEELANTLFTSIDDTIEVEMGDGDSARLTLTNVIEA